MIEIRIKEFAVHSPFTKNKKAPDKYIKLNAQSIYNGKLNRFGRANVMDWLHDYIIRHIPKKTVVNNYPVKIHYVIKTVINHGDIKLLKGVLNWKLPKEDYEPLWDIENLANIWIKAGNDALTKAKVILDDSVQYVNGVSYEFIPVTNLEDRVIIIRIYEND